MTWVIIGLLLRVAKVPRLGAAPTYDYIQQLAYLDSNIRPILGDYVAKQELVDIQDTGIIEQLNHVLENIDDSRKQKFRGSYVGKSRWGFLVQDMRPRGEFQRDGTASSHH